MRKIPFLFVCALGVLTLAVKESPADSLLFSRAMETPAPRGDATDVSARFSDASPGGFSLGLSDLIVGNAGMAGNDAMLAGMALGMTSPGTVRAISAVLAAGSRLGAGGGGGGGAAGGGGAGGGGKGSPGSTVPARYNPYRDRFGSASDTWQEFVLGELRNPSRNPQTRVPSFVGAGGGLFANLPPGLLDQRRPWHRLPQKVRDRLKTLLAGLPKPGGRRDQGTVSRRFFPTRGHPEAESRPMARGRSFQTPNRPRWH